MVGDVYVLYGQRERSPRHARLEFGTTRLLEVVALNRRKSSDLVGAIYDALHDFSANAPTHDDMTAVVVKITM